MAAKKLNVEFTAKDNMSNSVSKMSDAVEELGSKFEGLETPIDGAMAEFQSMAATKLADWAKNVGEALYSAAESAAEFETALTKVSTIADTSAVSMGELQSDITALSSEMGVGVNELSEAAYQALSASIDTADAVEFTGTATQLAVGGFTEAATAVDVLTTALNAYGLDASEAANISDMLVTTQNLGKTTVDELAQSMGRVIPSAAAYGVEMDNLASAYAVLTKNGIATAESSTYLKSMFNELGDTGSEVSAKLEEMSGLSFDRLMEQGYSLGDVMDMLGESVGNNTVEFSNLWSSQEAGVAALTLLNTGSEEYNATLEQMQTSAGATAEAYEAMTDTTEHAKDAMVNAAQNMANAVGEDLNPALKNLYEIGESAFTWMSDVIENHPMVSAGIAAVTAGVAAFAATLTVVDVVVPFATTAMAAFTAACEANPFILTATAIIAVTAAFGTLIAVAANADDKMDELTYSSKKQAEKIEDLQAEHDKLAEKYGENSTEALRLQYKIDDLTDAYEENKQTIGELKEKNDALLDSHTQLMDEYSDGLTTLDQQETKALSLVQQYEDLAAAQDNAAENSSRMNSIAAELNEQFPELAGVYENAAGNAEEYAKAAEKAVKSQMRAQKIEEANKQVSDFTANSGAIKEQIDYLEKERDEVEKALGDAQKAIAGELNNRDFSSGALTNQEAYDEAQKAASTYRTELDEVNSAIENLNTAYDEEIEKIEAAEQLANALIAARNREAASISSNAETEGLITQKDIYDELSLAAENFADDVTALQDAYQSAYDAAYSSLSGQVGLFNEVDATSELTGQQMLDRLQQQTQYLQNYQENLEKLRQYGFSEQAVQMFSDGSAESAASINQLVYEYENGGTAAGNGFVENFNAAVGEKEATLESASDYIAINDDDVQAQMTELEGKINTQLGGFDLSEGMKTAAENAVSAFVEATAQGLAADDVQAALPTDVDVTVTADTADYESNMASAGKAAGSFADDSKSMSKAVEQNLDTVDTNVNTSANNIEKKFGDIDLTTTGVNIVQGLINGINSKRQLLHDTVESLANDTTTTMSKAVDEGSPSRVTYRTGTNIALGAINGISDMLGKARDTAQSFANSLVLSDSDTEKLRNGTSYTYNNGGDRNVVVNMDMSGMSNNFKSQGDYETFIDRLKRELTEAVSGGAEGVHV